MKLKNEQRTVFGVGPKWFLWSFLLSSPVVVFSILTHPKYVIDSSIMTPFRVVGALLAIVGVAFYAVSLRAMAKGFSKNELVTTGVYALCRNPIYSSLVLAMLLGLAMFFGMPVLFLVPLIMAGILKVKIRQEEDELIEIFGEEYENYRNRANSLLPINIFITK